MKVETTDVLVAVTIKATSDQERVTCVTLASVRNMIEHTCQPVHSTVDKEIWNLFQLGKISLLPGGSETGLGMTQIFLTVWAIHTW